MSSYIQKEQFIRVAKTFTKNASKRSFNARSSQERVASSLGQGAAAPSGGSGKGRDLSASFASRAYKSKGGGGAAAPEQRDRLPALGTATRS